MDVSSAYCVNCVLSAALSNWLPASSVWFLWKGIGSKEGRNGSQGRESLGIQRRQNPQPVLRNIPGRPSPPTQTPAGRLGSQGACGREGTQGPESADLAWPWKRGAGVIEVKSPAFQVHRPACKRRGHRWQPGSPGHPPACCLGPQHPASWTFSAAAAQTPLARCEQTGAPHTPQAKAGQAFGSKTRQQAPQCGKKPCEARAVRRQMRSMRPHDRSGLFSTSGAEVAAIVTAAQMHKVVQAAQGQSRAGQGCGVGGPGLGLGEKGGRGREEGCVWSPLLTRPCDGRFPYFALRNPHNSPRNFRKCPHVSEGKTECLG